MTGTAGRDADKHDCAMGPVDRNADRAVTGDVHVATVLGIPGPG